MVNSTPLVMEPDALPVTNRAGQPFEKIVVAIHGIGSQLRSSTIRSVAAQFGARHTPPLPLMPLGFFSMKDKGEIKLSQLDVGSEDPLSRIAFVEVYWADIPAGVVKANDTLEESKAWGRTIVSRAQATYNKQLKEVREDQRRLHQKDFDIGADVVDELIEAITVFENLLHFADKAGLFKFELGRIMRDYIGDVQVVTDFPHLREEICVRFHELLGKIVDKARADSPLVEPEIYLVAHSEGTVISLLCLLEALDRFDNQSAGHAHETRQYSWISYVRGFMTIGSPIDKHIVLWPALWKDFQHLASQIDEQGEVVFQDGGHTRLRLKNQIKWRNYFDKADPVGFRLDSAAQFLQQRDCKAFEFEHQHDMGYSRSVLPGAAHNDYWEDSDVFKHFISDVVFREPAEPPKTSAWTAAVSQTIPYLLVFAVHAAAIFVLYRALVFSDGPVEVARASSSIALLSLCLMLLTVSARLTRLVKPDGVRWYVVAASAYAAAALIVWHQLPPGVLLYFSGALPDLSPLDPAYADELNRGRIVLLGFGLAVMLAAWGRPANARVGRTIPLGLAAVFLAVIIGTRLWADGGGEVWPVVVGGALFLYLWWLGIMLFDLSFIWHRYIRSAIAVRNLRCWQQKRDANPNPYFVGKDKTEPRRT